MSKKPRQSSKRGSNNQFQPTEGRLPIHERMQFRVTITENGEPIYSEQIWDPFITTTIIPEPEELRAKLDAGEQVVFVISVTGTPEALGAVMSADYSPLPDFPGDRATPELPTSGTLLRG